MEGMKVYYNYTQKNTRELKGKTTAEASKIIVDGKK